VNSRQERFLSLSKYFYRQTTLFSLFKNSQSEVYKKRGAFMILPLLLNEFFKEHEAIKPDHFAQKTHFIKSLKTASAPARGEMEDGSCSSVDKNKEIFHPPR
jgi:hypothetical protein